MVVGNTAEALVRHDPAKEFVPVWRKYYIGVLIANKFGGPEFLQFMLSAQNADAFPRALIKGVDAVLFPIEALAMILLSAYALRRGDRNAAALGAVIVCGYLGNALLTALAVGVFDRYQARVSWLFPFGAILLAASLARQVSLRDVVAELSAALRRLGPRQAEVPEPASLLSDEAA